MAQKQFLELLARAVQAAEYGLAFGRPFHAETTIPSRLNDRVRSGEHPWAAVLALVLEDPEAFATVLGRFEVLVDLLRFETSSGEVVLMGWGARPPDAGAIPPKQDESILISTDLVRYDFHLVSEGRLRPRAFAHMSASQMDRQLALQGSIAAVGRPSHFALFSRTVAFDMPVPPSEPRFGYRWPQKPVSREAKALQVLRRLERPDRYQLTDIERMEAAALQPSSVPGKRRLAKSQTRLARPLQFADDTTEPARGDWVSFVRDLNGDEFGREFAVMSIARSEEHAEVERLTHNLVHLLAIRRTKLFRSEFANRVYSVVLPTAHVVGPFGEVILIPCLLLHRLPRTWNLRETITVTFVAVPCESSQDGKSDRRKVSIDEIHRIRRALKLSSMLFDQAPTVSISGALIDYLGGPVPSSLPELAEQVLRSISKDLMGTACPPDFRQSSSVLDACRESSLGTVNLLTEWRGGNTAWEDWAGGRSDSALEWALFQTMFYPDFIEPDSAFARSRTVDLRSLEVGNAHGADMSGLSFYNPTDECKYVFYPLEMERFPNHSILRWFAWQIYIDSALTALRALLIKFHAQLESGDDLTKVLSTAQGVSNEFTEMYDLDLTDYFYRREFENIRSMLQLEADYEYMKDRLDSAREEASLREQMLVNNLILAFTVSTIIVAIMIAFGQESTWGPWRLALVTLGIVLFSGVASFALFDPARSLLEKFLDRWRRTRDGRD